MSPLRAVIAVAAALVIGGGVVAAAEAPPEGRGDARAEARRLFESGTGHYNLGELKEALADFQGAYRLVHEPTLLFNIGQCYRRMDQPRQAADMFRAYRREQPDAANRAEVDRLIREMDERAPPLPGPVVPIEDTTTTTLTKAPPPPGRTPVYRRWWLWTAVGAVVVTGVAIGLGVGLSQSGGPTSDLGTVRPF
jgi:tetratricopeptide (TPR) repeat protein